MAEKEAPSKFDKFNGPLARNIASLLGANATKDDVLIMASCLYGAGSKLYESVLGEDGTKKLLRSMGEEGT